MSEENGDDLCHIPQLALRLRLLKQAEKRIHIILSEDADGKESEAGNDPAPIKSEPEGSD